MKNKRYVIKKTTEPLRGQSGKLDVWYVYDSKEKRICTATSPFKPDVEKMCNFLQKKEEQFVDDPPVYSVEYLEKDLE